jgi:hypothetical protein
MAEGPQWAKRGLQAVIHFHLIWDLHRFIL